MKCYRTLRDFDRFCTPNNHVLDGFYQFLDFHCLKECSYIHYIIFSNDDKLRSSVISCDYEDMKKYYYRGYYVIAFNHLDNICLEVK